MEPFKYIMVLSSQNVPFIRPSYVYSFVGPFTGLPFICQFIIRSSPFTFGTYVCIE